MSGPTRDPMRAPMRGDLARLGAAIGVTRVARITGLDRAGVEVAAAIRPGGHVLQVTAGKGERWDEAARGALSEAAELDAAERPRVDARGSFADLSGQFGEAVVDPASLAPGDAAPWWRGLRLAWREAIDLASGGARLIPAHAVHCPPPGSEPLGLAVIPWTSSGLAAHPDRDAALLHALLELCERHQLARALPGGFTPAAVRRHLLDPVTLRRAAPRTAARRAALEARGFAVHLFDLSGPGRGPGRLATAAALLADREGGPVPLTAGYACRAGRDEALLAALLEAAQSRLTEIHGAREDLLDSDREAAAPLLRWCSAARPSRRASAMPDHPPAPPAEQVARLARRLASAGSPPLAADLDGPPGLAVVKVLAPGLLRSELLG
jgi:ribosomal protein S12 methylthiotransferase accessory factor